MIQLVAENLAPIMFLSLVVVLLLGFPVAFSLSAVGLGFFVIGVYLAPLAPSAITLSWPLLGALPDRVFDIMSNEVLLAVPFFTFMGLILQRSGMAEDLLETVGQLFGPVRGGLAYAVILVGALLAATTGVIAATVISMGMIALPIMLRYGYNRSLASGTIAASGTLSQIVPPSIVLIVLGDQLNRSVGDMYAGAVVPALLLCTLYLLYVFIVTIFFPKAVPNLPPEALVHKEDNGKRGIWQLFVLLLFSNAAAWAIISRLGTYSETDFIIIAVCAGSIVACASAWLARWFSRTPSGLALALTFVLLGAAAWLDNAGMAGAFAVVAICAAASLYAFAATLLDRRMGIRLVSRIAAQFTFVMVPPLLLIFLVLGTIFIGIATPTEAGAMGAVGAVVLALIKRITGRDPEKLNMTIIVEAARSTAQISAFAIFILIGARVFSLAFYGVNGHVWVEHLLTGLPGGVIGFLIIINIAIFLLALFLDFFEIAFIIIPLLVPAAEVLGIDLVWLGIMLAVNMQTSFMSPPFGFALFYLRSVAPNKAYIDRISKKTIAPVTTGQIYLGALPFLVIQLLLVGIIIAFPDLVMHYKADHTTLSPDEVTRQLDSLAFPDFFDLDADF